MAGRDKQRERSGSARLAPAGLTLSGETVPLISGAMHYWRLEPFAWRPALEALASLGFRFVDVYVPWAVHETGAGEYDFGRVDVRRDVRRFVDLCDALDLFVILRPGPHINAELTCFGIPERVIWDAECQARSPDGKPVVLPVPPLAFPVPSYASSKFHDEVAHWFDAVGAELADRQYPDGPIALLQVDNEGAMYFRDGVYDQDYHPDALSLYRRFLQRRYGTVEALRQAYADPSATFARLEPPRELSAHLSTELCPHLDWAELQEELLADAFRKMRNALDGAGLGRVPTMHNLPLSEGATPLDPARIGETVDLVGLDYYHGASMPQRREIARRTSELSERARGRRQPAFACELGAGFPPFFPPLRHEDNMFSLLTALAYGLRAFNAYMAVERDRWIGSPIDARGRKRDSARDWESLIAALERTNFAELDRQTPVHIVIPRSQRRLARVCHAFGPLSAALFQVMGGGAPEACFEDDFGLGAPVVIEAERFVRRVEEALENERIPYAVVSGDLLEQSLATARWVIVSCTGALEPELLARIAQARASGFAVTLGPFEPTRDDRMLPVSQRLDASAARSGVPAQLDLDAAAITDAVKSARELLALPTVAVTPRDVFATLHRDSSGRPAVLFVINPTERSVDATVTAAGAREAVDALSGESLPSRLGALSVTLPAHGVRMLELRSDV